MDSDGEDRPIEIKDLINENYRKPKISVVAKELKDPRDLVFNDFIYP